MSKRQYNPNIWDERWFLMLTYEYKLAWKYIKDHCDWAGVWEIDMLTLREKTDCPGITIREMVTQLNKDWDKYTGDEIVRTRVIWLEEKKVLWVTGYVQFHNENNDKEVNPTSLAAKSAFKRLKEHGLLKKCIASGYIKFTRGYEALYQKAQGANDNDNDILKLLTLQEAKTEGKRVQGGKGDQKNGGLDIATGNFLIQEMQTIWCKKFPVYPFDPEVDYPHLLTLAQHICDLKKWNHAEILNGKLTEGLNAWSAITEFCVGDTDWFAIKSLRDIATANEWRRLVQKMNRKKKELEKNKDKTGGFDTGSGHEEGEEMYDRMSK